MNQNSPVQSGIDNLVVIDQLLSRVSIQGQHIGGWKVVTTRSTLASLESYCHNMDITRTAVVDQVLVPFSVCQQQLLSCRVNLPSSNECSLVSPLAMFECLQRICAKTLQILKKRQVFTHR